jgi:hypothetical protein
MSFIARSGAASFPTAGDTVYVYDTGTTDQVTGLTDLDGGALSQPITVPAVNSFWGFDTPDDRKVDIWWVEGARIIVEKAIVKKGQWIPIVSSDPSLPATGDMWIYDDGTDKLFKIKTSAGTIIFNAFQYLAD